MAAINQSLLRTAKLSHYLEGNLKRIITVSAKHTTLREPTLVVGEAVRAYS